MSSVSIVIPCYNSESFIEECLVSVFNQTFKNIEVIVIDNNSKDGTWSNLESLQNKFGEQLTIEKEFKVGAPAARNKGLSLAKSKYIQFLDADDILMPNKIEHQVSLFENQPEAAFIAAAFNDQNLQSESETKLISDDGHENWLNLMNSQLGITSANFWKKSALEGIDGWNESLTSSQEYDLMFRLMKENPIIIVDHEVNTIRMERSAEQISKSDPKIRWDNFFQLRKRIIDFLKKEKTTFFNKNKEVLNQCFFDSIRLLANYDLGLASKYFRENFPNGYQPIISPGTTGSYIKLFNLLGFKNTERIKKLIS